MTKITINDLRTWKQLANDINQVEEAETKDLQAVVNILESGAVEAYKKGKSAKIQNEATGATAEILECFKYEIELRAETKAPKKEEKKTAQKKTSKKLSKGSKSSKSTKAPEKKESAPEEEKQPVKTTLKAKDSLTFSEKKGKKEIVSNFRVVNVDTNLVLLQNAEDFKDCFVAEVEERQGLYILKDVGSNWQTIAEKK